MSLLNDVKRIAKLVRETLILEVLRDFPALGEEQLRDELEFWREAREWTNTETVHFADHGVLPDGTSCPMGIRSDRNSVLTQSGALQMIKEILPDITPDDLRTLIVFRLKCEKKANTECEFYAKHGYWPEMGGLGLSPNHRDLMIE